MLTLGFNSVALDDVVVVVRSFKAGLHFGKLVLNSIKLDTSFFTGLSNFADFFFFLTKLKINTLMLICELFGEGVLQGDHKNLKRVRLRGSYIHGQLVGKSRLHRRSTNQRHPVTNLVHRHNRCCQDYPDRFSWGQRLRSYLTPLTLRRFTYRRPYSNQIFIKILLFSSSLIINFLILLSNN